MGNWFTKIHLQPFAVIGGFDARRSETTPSQHLLGATGNVFSVNAGTSNMTEVSRPENQVLRMTFSSVPVISRSELSRDYWELGRALAEMTELDDDEWKIDAAVFQVACRVATVLSEHSFPAPRVFNHGPKSVVFNWPRGNDNVYLTISSDFISALVSTPERIKRRVEFSTTQALESEAVFRGLLCAPSDQAFVSTPRSMSQVTGFVE
jgi:hypothetical protein